MDPQRFDTLTRALTRGAEKSPTRRSLLATLGAGLVAAGMLPSPATEAKRKKNKCKPPCGFNTVCAKKTCVAAPNRCSGPTGICDADPTPCGTAANGETCGCESTVEGNNFCANAVDACTDVECTSSQECRDAVGFGFYCQEAKTNANGQFCGCGFGTATGRVCVAECDNPN
jgi:hypothetical protein